MQESVSIKKTFRNFDSVKADRRKVSIKRCLTVPTLIFFNAYLLYLAYINVSKLITSINYAQGFSYFNHLLLDDWKYFMKYIVLDGEHEILIVLIHKSV